MLATAIPDCSTRFELLAPGNEVPEDNFRNFVAIWNDVQGYGTPNLHRRLADWLDAERHDRKAPLLLMVFRDAGKSTLVGLFCAYLLYTDPNLRILVLSAEHQLAMKMTRDVRRIIERHPWTKHLKPKRSELWAADQLTVERSRNLRDPSLLARGISGNITGSRADVIICDDVEVPNTCDTPQKRAALRARLAEVSFILVPNGLQLYVGTPHSYYSIYAPTPRSEIGETAPFLADARRLSISITDQFGRSSWPERFSLTDIERVKRQVGPIRYRSQMMLIPAHAHEMRFDPEQLVRYDESLRTTYLDGRPQLTLGERRLVSGSCWWDPAFGQPGKGDASVVAAVFVDDKGDYWLHALRYLQVDPGRTAEEAEADQQCRAVAELLRELDLPAVTVESNGIGKFLPSLLRHTIRRSGLLAAVNECHSVGNKDTRILNTLDPILAARRLHAHGSIWSTPFIEEMREWRPGGGSRDDGLDAVSGCLSLEAVRNAPLPPATRQTGRWRPGSSTFHATTEFQL